MNPIMGATGGAMPDVTICAVCGKPIDLNESRVVDVRPVTGEKRHVHLECKKKTR